jgi:hypothetical protein
LIASVVAALAVGERGALGHRGAGGLDQLVGLEAAQPAAVGHRGLQPAVEPGAV